MQFISYIVMRNYISRENTNDKDPIVFNFSLVKQIL